MVELRNEDPRAFHPSPITDQAWNLVSKWQSPYGTWPLVTPTETCNTPGGFPTTPSGW
ncbi:hypothetical protein DPMN_132160 [Dreissena polymorpha]|uniref:Uncharacterized protein n=1 Tax=Dreissena polymorpha TaxID=45954 RepID=A0A9D4FRZ8_DREPO|nr:hypothetical protein DPMN_132160 [Dreissena polymorpha]